MAFLGDIFIAGTEHLDGKYKSGVVFSISRKSPLSYIQEFDAGSWQVEFRKHSDTVIVRSTSKLDRESLQSSGFAAVQTALDFLSVKGILSAFIPRPFTENIGVYWSNSKSVVYLHSVFDIGMGISAQVQQFDARGYEITPTPLEPIWNESFRYYRLSQSSTDLFEAYRNLFLAFEALLNTVCCKNRNEGEKEWLRRALSITNSRICLKQFVPERISDPIKYIIDSQYVSVRCKLQHAKFPAAELPHSSINPITVRHAYSELVKIWRQIAGDYLNIPTGGGVMTYNGFEKMMKNRFRKGSSIQYTSDNLPPKKEDTAVSPQALPIHVFQKNSFIGQIQPGVVRIVGSEYTSGLTSHYDKPIHRVCSLLGTTLYSIAYIEHGLMVKGVDRWESVNDFRLVNTAKPKVAFET